MDLSASSEKGTTKVVCGECWFNCDNANEKWLNATSSLY